MESGVTGQLWVERRSQDPTLACHHDFYIDGATGPVDGHPVAVRQGHVLATSFHPELTGDARVHRLFVSSITGTQD